MNQEAFGSETSLPWGMVSENTHGVAVHPCFFYEFLWCALGFVLLHIFTRKFRRYDGQTFLLYVMWYGTGRFFIEALRTDSLMVPYLNIKSIPIGCRGDGFCCFGTTDYLPQTNQAVRVWCCFGNGTESYYL